MKVCVKNKISTICFALLFFVGAISPVISCGSAGDSAGETAVVIDGYQDKFSYNPGETATLYLNGKEQQLANLRLYNVNGAEVGKIIVDLTSQKILNPNPWENGYGYKATTKITVPNLKSGLYLWENKVPFLIKRADKEAEIVIVYPSNTENAYNNKGGRSMYSIPVTRIASFLRPAAHSIAPLAEYFMKWFEPYTDHKVKYISDQDMDDYNNIDKAKLIIIIGHSEYWARKARENFDKFVDAGKHGLILSGNTMWWQVRYSGDNSQMICYKTDPDPISDPLLKTVLWTDATLRYPIISSIGGDFDHGGYGLNVDKGWDGFKIIMPDSPIFDGIPVNKGEIISLPSGEYDGTLITGFNNEGYPIIDLQKLGFYKGEIIGYDFGYRSHETVGTWLVIQKSASSGIVIDAATYDWCSRNGIGGKDGEKIKKITTNMINILLNHSYIFRP